MDGGQPGGERQGLGAVSQAYPGGSWAAPTLALRPVGQRAPSSLLPPPDHQTLGPGYTGAQRLTGQDPTQALPPPGSAPVPSLAKRVTTLSRPLWAPVASLLVSPPPCVASEPLVKCVWGSHGRVAGAALVRSLTAPQGCRTPRTLTPKAPLCSSGEPASAAVPSPSTCLSECVGWPACGDPASLRGAGWEAVHSRTILGEPGASCQAGAGGSEAWPLPSLVPSPLGGRGAPDALEGGLTAPGKVSGSVPSWVESLLAGLSVAGMERLVAASSVCKLLSVHGHQGGQGP